MNKEEYIKTNLNELFKFWAIRAIQMGVVFFLLQIYIDNIIAKENLPILIIYRLINVSILFLIYLFIKRPYNPLVIKGLFYIAFFSANITAALIIAKTGGHSSIYVIGVVMIAIAVIGFIPASVIFHLPSAVIIYAFYVIPIIATDAFIDLPSFTGSNMLVIFTIIMMLYLRYVHEKKLKLQFSLQYDLEKLKHNLQNEVNNQTERLRNLTMHIQSISEQERTRIAREIHDELGQALTSMKMDTFWLKKKMPEDQGVLREKIDSMANLISDTISTVQRISSELRPRLLDDLGLQAAMEWHAKDFQERTGIACDMTVDLKDDHLDQDHSTTIFRTFQESLTNVARHADATEVFVRLKENGDNIVMTVADNGKGIEEKQKKDPESFGLIGMRERVRHLGGSIEIHGVKNQGTTIKAVIPGNNKKNNDSIM
jgi:signal transduction histidine kinase